MEPRFTRGEYWLLEIVVEREFPVHGLIDSELEWALDEPKPKRTDRAGKKKARIMG